MIKSVWILFREFWGVLKSPFRFILDALKSIWLRIGQFFTEHTYVLRKKFSWIGKKIDDFTSIFLGKSGFFVKAFLVFQSVISLISAIISVLLFALGINQVFNLGKSVLNPNEYFLNLLAEQLNKLPSWSSTFTGIDNELCSSTGSVLTPCFTISGFWAKCGVSYLVNQCVQTLLQCLVFTLSIFLLRWFMNRMKTSFTKGV